MNCLLQVEVLRFEEVQNQWQNEKGKVTWKWLQCPVLYSMFYAEGFREELRSACFSCHYNDRIAGEDMKGVEAVFSSGNSRRLREYRWSLSKVTRTLRRLSKFAGTLAKLSKVARPLAEIAWTSDQSLRLAWLYSRLFSMWSKVSFMNLAEFFLTLLECVASGRIIRIRRADNA